MCLIRSSQFPDSGRSAKLGIFELDSSEPDVGDLTHPAMSGLLMPAAAKLPQRASELQSE